MRPTICSRTCEAEDVEVLDDRKSGRSDGTKPYLSNYVLSQDVADLVRSMVLAVVGRSGCG